MKNIVTLTLNPALDKTLTVEGFEAGCTNRVLSKTVHLGGKGINVARVAKSFYDKVVTLGFDTEEFKAPLLQELGELGIESDFVTVPGETRTNIKIYDRKTGITTELNEGGFSVSSAHLSLLLQKIEAILPKTELFVLTGSLPGNVSNGIYADIIRLCHSYGVKAILDADGEAFREGITAKPYAIKPNLDELIHFAQKPLETEEEILEQMQAIIHSGVSLVVASAGSQGAYFMNEDQTFYAPALSICVKSTVGAGDSMVAAMAYGVIQNLPLRETARLSVAAGGVTTSKEGTGLCAREEVLEKCQEVRIEARICE